MVAEHGANISCPIGLDGKARTMVAETVTRDDSEVSETMMTSRSCGGRGEDDRPDDWECNGCGVDVIGFKNGSWDVGTLNDGISGSDEICAHKYNYLHLELKGKARDEKCQVSPWRDKTTQVERDSAGVLPRGRVATWRRRYGFWFFIQLDDGSHHSRVVLAIRGIGNEHWTRRVAPGVG